MNVLAVDMGTSSCKAVAFSADGNMLAQATQSYSAESHRPSWSEMSPDSFWQALVGVTHSIAAVLSSTSLEALAISSHGETFVPVDGQNCPVGPAILNADNRAVAEADWLSQSFGREKLFETTGLASHAMYPVPKLLWLRKHQPEIFSRTATFVSLPGYLLSKLGLPAYVDYSLASRFLAFDIHERTWSSEILACCDLSRDLFPTPVTAGTIVGHLSQQAASDLGLQVATPVVLGGHDQPCAALGSGVINQGRISASLGTYECLVAASEAPALGKEALAANLNSYCHVVPDRFVTLAYFPSGIMVEWFLRLFHGLSESGTGNHHDLLSELEASAAAPPTGLGITPHLLGTCNPDFDPSATGVIAGIRPTTSRADIYKGILEGVACEFAAMAELLQQAAGPYHDVYISGGGGRSRLGLQLRSAISGRTLHVLQSQEAVCLGTAILAGVVLKEYANFADAIEQVVRISETISPDASIAADYEGLKKQYHTLYASLAPLRSVQQRTEETK